MFRSEHATVGWPAMSHASYLINLAAGDPVDPGQEPRRAGRGAARAPRSWASTSWSCTRARTSAPGATTASTRPPNRCPRCTNGRAALRVRLLLEITAGQGSCLGCRFDDMAAHARRARAAATRWAICFDTCHAHAAGLDLSTEEGYERAFDDFARTIGLDRLRAFHLNDSKTPAGSRVDRHAEIGDGYLGLLPFWRLVNDARFATVPAVLETPSGPDKQPSFARNLARLRALIGAPRPPGPPKSQALPDERDPRQGRLFAD